MQCRLCGTEIHEKPGGHRARQYCSDRCKTAYFRRLKAPTLTVQSGDRDLAQALAEAQARIEELERDLEEAYARARKLTQTLDIEKRYLYGTEALNFKAWLKKHRLSGLPDVGKKLLEEEWLEPRGSRSRYERFLRKAGYTPDDILDFEDLWRVMLLDQE